MFKLSPLTQQFHQTVCVGFHPLKIFLSLLISKLPGAIDWETWSLFTSALYFVCPPHIPHHRKENKKSFRTRRLQFQSCGLGKSFTVFGFHFWNKVEIQLTANKLKIFKCFANYHYGNQNYQNCHSYLSSNLNIKSSLYARHSIFATEKI